MSSLAWGWVTVKIRSTSSIFTTSHVAFHTHLSKSLVPCCYLQFTVLHVTLVYTYVQYIQGLCQSRLGISDHAQTHAAHYNCLVTWMVIHLTTTKLKPLTFFCVGLHLFRCCKNLHFHDFVWPLLVACKISLCNHKYTVLGKPCATHGSVCTSEIYQWCGEPSFASTATSKHGYLPQIPRWGMHKSLLI
jgi:hypothetical protein